MCPDLFGAQLYDCSINIMGGGLTKEVLESKHVCIIGGGYAGMAAAVRLKELGIPFTLIDKKNFFYHCVGVLRGVVEPGIEIFQTQVCQVESSRFFYLYRLLAQNHNRLRDYFRVQFHPRFSGQC